MSPPPLICHEGINFFLEREKRERIIKLNAEFQWKQSK